MRFPSGRLHVSLYCFGFRAFNSLSVYLRFVDLLIIFGISSGGSFLLRLNFRLRFSFGMFLVRFRLNLPCWFSSLSVCSSSDHLRYKLRKLVSSSVCFRFNLIVSTLVFILELFWLIFMRIKIEKKFIFVLTFLNQETLKVSL